MALALCSDPSPADWIQARPAPWEQLVAFGPPGFPAHARLRFLPDPTRQGQRENDVDWASAACTPDQWQALFELLAGHTATPGECYFCLWEGWPFEHRPHQPTVSVPRDHPVPARRYFLFHGALSQPGEWGPDFASRGGGWYEPAFVWPMDHAWCVAKDVDPHWAGIGASVSLIERLVANPRLDAVDADPADTPPAYA